MGAQSPLGQATRFAIGCVIWARVAFPPMYTAKTSPFWSTANDGSTSWKYGHSELPFPPTKTGVPKLAPSVEELANSIRLTDWFAAP